MAREPEEITLAEVVGHAARAADPEGTNEAVERFLEWFEDRDEPVTAVPDIDAALAEAVTAIDPVGDEPALAMARAVATYLAYRRDEAGEEREALLRLAARAEFDDDPPEPVAAWLAAQGV